MEPALAISTDKPMPKPCRAACGGYMEPFLDLGIQPMANGFHYSGSRGPRMYWLRPCICTKCGLIQLWETLPQDTLFNSDYPFRTGTSARMVDHFSDFALSVNAYSHPPDEVHPLVIEIGCNDGTLLKAIQDLSPSADCIGVDPALGAANDARRKGLTVYGIYFDSRAVMEICGFRNKKANLIVASNVICHIPQPHETFKAVAEALKPRGVFVFEEPYVLSVYDNYEFEQFYDEHPTILGIIPVARMAEAVGLELFHVEPQSTHGGSMRYYVCHKGQRPLTVDLERETTAERARGLTITHWEQWGRKCRSNVTALGRILDDYRQQGKRVCAYGATSKSTVLYSWMLKLGYNPAKLIDCVFDNTPHKIGKVVPLAGDDFATYPGIIPIRDANQIRQENIDCILLTAWNHAEEIMGKEEWFTGGWITYVPEVVVTHNGRYHGEKMQITTNYSKEVA